MIKKIAMASLMLDAAAPAVRAQQTSLPDKNGYTLFNPTPVQYLRELSADRPDKTDCPFTVDAGHFQLEMDFANFAYDAPAAAHDKLKAEDYQLAPMNVKVGALNNADFQLVLQPCQWQRIGDKTTGTVENNAGFGGIVPRVKVDLIGNAGGVHIGVTAAADDWHPWPGLARRY